MFIRLHFLTSWCCFTNDVQTSLIQSLVRWITQNSSFYSFFYLLVWSFYCMHTYFPLVLYEEMLWAYFWLLNVLISVNFSAMFSLAMKWSIMDFYPLVLLHVTLYCYLWLRMCSWCTSVECAKLNQSFSICIHSFCYICI